MKRIFCRSKLKNVSVSIGIFDGVHRGHKRILNKLVKIARLHRSKSLVVTFYPHPRSVVNPDTKVSYLTSLEHRLRLIKDMGVDYFLLVRFTKSLSRMKADEFIEKLLMRHFEISSIVVGKDFLFGNKKKGDFPLLKKISKKFSFKLYGVNTFKVNGKIASSTRIRGLVEKGLLKEAKLLLGRDFSVLGTVVKGRKIGRLLGFPTANIDPHHEAIPPSGVYKAQVKLDDKKYRGVINIGTRPTFVRKKEPAIELHIMDFKKNIYGRDIEVVFIKKLRDEIKFNSVEALRNQIRLDIDRAK